MPWVYTLTLSVPVDAIRIQNDWHNNIPGTAQVLNEYGGVAIRGKDAIIVSQRNNPDYEAMGDLSYVASIGEYKEIPNSSDAEFEVPIELAPGFEISGGQEIDGVQY